MNIQHFLEKNKGKFFITNNEKVVAEMTYTYVGPSKITIEHTEVDESLKGQGVARKLLIAVATMARAQSLKVNATCTYAMAALEKTAEFSDIFDL